MKFLKKITIFTIICAILYLAGSFLLACMQLTYRAWLDALGKLVIIQVLPLLGIIWIGIWLKNKCKWHFAVRGIVMLIAAVIYAGWAFLGFLVLVLSLDEEKMLTSNLLALEQSNFLDECYYEYYRPFTWFFKKPTELTVQDVLPYLEEKYGREFQIADADKFVFYDKEFPQVRVSARLSGTEFEDDFVEGVLVSLLQEGMEALEIDREYYVKEGFAGRNGTFYICLENESDIPKLAEDVCRLTEYIYGKTDFFEDNKGSLYFYCGEMKGSISFGGDAYYLEKVQKSIWTEYDRAVEIRRQQEAYQKEWEAARKAQREQEEQAKLQEDAIEACAQIIYDEVLEEQGYTYEVCYNAKGNLYLNLGSRPAGEPGDYYDTGTYRFTLVYDRTSKNGTCELFVLYKEHYTEEKDGMSSNDTTAILDMYGVEVKTGKVTAADKQSWSDVGTEEYRELTGE